MWLVTVYGQVSEELVSFFKATGLVCQVPCAQVPLTRCRGARPLAASRATASVRRVSAGREGGRPPTWVWGGCRVRGGRLGPTSISCLLCRHGQVPRLSCSCVNTWGDCRYLPRDTPKCAVFQHCLRPAVSPTSRPPLPGPGVGGASTTLSPAPCPPLRERPALCAMT